MKNRELEYLLNNKYIKELIDLLMTKKSCTSCA